MKTPAFRATQDHALAVRDLVDRMKTSSAPNRCRRVSADEGARGDRHPWDVRQNEKSIPTIPTTSQNPLDGVARCMF
jgi:type I restriction enzyme R subunit